MLKIVTVFSMLLFCVRTQVLNLSSFEQYKSEKEKSKELEDLTLGGGDWDLDIICDKNEVDNLDEWLSFDNRNWELKVLCSANKEDPDILSLGGESWDLNIICSNENQEDESLDLGGVGSDWDLNALCTSEMERDEIGGQVSGGHSGEGHTSGSGGQFLKSQANHKDAVELPYRVTEKYYGYEKRYYPAATFVCNKTSVDTAADPFAGLDDMDPFILMSSKRYKRRHESQMFMELFRYISGVNQNQEKIEMTRPVVVFHNVTKETPLGNYEDLCMCFYLPSKYQEDHSHEEVRSSRHVPEAPPQPLDGGSVYLYSAPAHHVYVRRFGGYALTHNQWEKQMKALEAELVYKRHQYQEGQYYTAGYDHPYKPFNRRNEVWIESL